MRPLIALSRSPRAACSRIRRAALLLLLPLLPAPIPLPDPNTLRQQVLVLTRRAQRMRAKLFVTRSMPRTEIATSPSCVLMRSSGPSGSMISFTEMIWPSACTPLSQAAGTAPAHLFAAASGFSAEMPPARRAAACAPPQLSKHPDSSRKPEYPTPLYAAQPPSATEGLNCSRRAWRALWPGASGRRDAFFSRLFRRRPRVAVSSSMLKRVAAAARKASRGRPFPRASFSKREGRAPSGTGSQISYAASARAPWTC